MGFTGVSEYLDDLVAWIDAPLLDKSDTTVTFFIKYSTFHDSQFICHTSMPKVADEVPVIVSQSNNLVVI